MRAVVAVIVSILVCVFAAYLFTSYQAPADTSDSTPTVRYETDPGWDCHTMGNKICGSK